VSRVIYPTPNTGLELRAISRGSEGPYIQATIEASYVLLTPTDVIIIVDALTHWLADHRVSR